MNNPRPLKIAFQIDHPSNLNPKTDTSLAMMNEFKKMGHECSYFTPNNLFVVNCQIFADVSLMQEHLPNVKLDTAHKKQDLKQFDILFIRNDPPVNMSYVSYLHLLKNLEKNVFIVNTPSIILQNCEKILPIEHFPEFTPQTLISSNLDEILRHISKFKKLVAKPLFAHGGNDVFQITNDDPNTIFIIQNLLEKYRAEPIIIQEFLEEIHEQGDARVVIVAGEIVSTLRRHPGKDSIRANLAAGGSGEISQLSDSQLKIAKIIANKIYREIGIVFAGLDLIGDHLTEINITSPTGIAGNEKAIKQTANIISSEFHQGKF